MAATMRQIRKVVLSVREFNRKKIVTHWQSNTESIEPWYKQFWPWFLMALPASVVVAGLTTWFIAAKNSDSLVVDDYYKEGLGINRQLAEDQLAKQLAIEADIRFDTVVGEVIVNMQGQLEAWPEQLTLRLIHPADSEKDIVLTMNKVSVSRYIGQLEQPISGYWYLQVAGQKPEPWRLRGRIDADSGPWHLQ